MKSIDPCVTSYVASSQLGFQHSAVDRMTRMPSCVTLRRSFFSHRSHPSVRFSPHSARSHTCARCCTNQLCKVFLTLRRIQASEKFQTGSSYNQKGTRLQRKLQKFQTHTAARVGFHIFLHVLSACRWLVLRKILNCWLLKKAFQSIVSASKSNELK